LAIGKNSFDHKIVFELKGNRIECENDVKLLGVTIDYELKFDKHISDISFLKYFFSLQKCQVIGQ
jgi:hypothetical protein